MPKETHLPISYHTQHSPHRPRHHYPMHHGTSRPPQQQQPPPSSAAAKAAAAAKALHRRALDRAQQKQSAPPSHPPPQRHDPRYDHRHDDYPASKSEDRRRSTMAVFRRSSPETTEEKPRGAFRMEGYSSRQDPPPSHAAHAQHSQGHPSQPPPAHSSQNRSRRREDEYSYAEQPLEKSDNAPPNNFTTQPMYPYGMPGYPYPYGMPPPGAPSSYPDEEEKTAAAPLAAPSMIHRPREDYHYAYHYDPNYYDPNFQAHAAAAAQAGYPPYYPYPYPPQPPPGEKKEEKRVSYKEQDREREQQPSRSTRRIIGSHTPIHVPRADSPMHYAHPPGAPNSPTAGRASVFRSQDNISQQERNAHEILLSLSKSFDKRDGERPKSPEEPPRLKHFHKENGEGFEPSPLRPTNETENNIEFAPSFTLFNQSFDMNLENLLGPNASFGLGPMKSLSFGLGLGSIDYSDNPRASPISIHRAGSPVDKSKGDGENVQVLRASPSTDFGNVLKAASSGSERKKGTMLLGDSVRVSSPSAIDKKRSRSSSPKEKNIVLDGNARDLPFRLKDDAAVASEGKENGKLDILEPPQKKKKTKSSRVDIALLKIFENHQSVFADFSFLLPGAKSILTNPKRTHPDVEIARRRINSALCAFGGSALPKHSWSTRMTASRQKYESLLPERYYEDDNRLSWEVEEDPPVEISDEESDKNSVPKSRSLACDSSDGSLSLQRNMGVMVYPAINAFVAAEPGLITPALSEMNNFVSGKKSPECTPAKGTTLPPVSKPKLPMVSPDCVKGAESSGLEDKSSVNYAGGAWISNHQSQGQISKKEEDVPDHLFIDKQDLVPEQYRIITNKRQPQSYDYPTLPVPYAQRKRMSNAVFAMSKSIPGLTDECAVVLSDARKKDAWDFAVAELMTQVVVLTHCQEGDWRLDGLSKYLLSLGIAC